MLGDDVAVIVQDLVHHIGGVQVAAVDAGRLGPDQRQGRDVEGLAEGIGRQGDHVGVELRPAGENSADLADHVHAGGLHKAEGLQIVIVAVRTDLQAHGDKGWVAGVAGGHLQGLGAVAAAAGTADGLAPALDLDGAGAGEGGVHVHHALLQGRRQGQGLEGGAGLIGGVDALVAPLGIQNIAGGLADRRLIVLLRGVAALVLFQGRQGAVQLCLQLLVVNGAVVVEVIIRVRGHGQDSPGVHIHDDAGGTVGGVELIRHALDALFQIVLDVAVQSQHQVFAVFRVVILLILVKQVAAGGVFGGDCQSGGAGEDAVVLGLQAHAALVVAVHEADDVGGQGAVGVIPLGVRLHPNAPELHPLAFRHLVARVVDLAVDEAADIVGDLLVHLFLHHLILGEGALHFFQDGLLVHAQQPLQAPGDIGLVSDLAGDIGLSLFLGLRGGLLLFPLLLHILHNVLGRDAHGLRRGGDGQRQAVAVIDRAPGRRDHGAAGLLGHGLFLQFIMLVDLQVVQLPKQQQKCDDAQQHHHQQRPAADHLVGPAGGFTFSGGCFCHGLRPPVLLQTGSKKAYLPYSPLSVHYSAAVS